ncbi:MAG: dihydroorotate dehydrogenase B catalytic subunit [Acidiferrobacteraceae bacterium]|nr:dihydroorotate dehydrogenase B catalytic subunit [Acidiferrobacteraceae bacterium]|tara:strand:- start:75 stop:1001 length:927 start_codon:yes stop_codon:yes gene_type:complete
MANLQVTLAGLHLDNPVMLASGILDSTPGILRRMSKMKVGALITKSISIKPRPGYPGPTAVETTPGTWINAMGLPNPGLNEFVDEFSLTNGSVTIIPNLVADTPDEFAKLADAVAVAGAKIAEINLSCPHPKASYKGRLAAQDPRAAAEVVEAASTKLPIIAKLTPNVTDIGEIAVACARAGASAISAINTLAAIDIDPELERPILGNGYGGLSGAGIRPIGLRKVLDIVQALTAANLDTPVIGMGGICDADDVVRYILCGAHLVQVGTTLAGNPEQLSNITEGLADWMDRKGYQNLEDFRGRVLEWF